MKHPFDDDKLIYDEISHRYSLNPNSTIIGRYVPNYLVAYGQDVQSNLDSQSFNVYQYIYSHTSKNNYEYFEYLLACDESLRNYVFEMLLEQLKYDINSGGNSIAHEHLLDKEPQFDRVVAYNIKGIISNKLKMDTAADCGIRMPEDRYERYGY